MPTRKATPPAPEPEENHSEAVEVAGSAEVTPEGLAEENEAMQAQLLFQAKQLFKALQKQGIAVEELFETPPSATTAVFEPVNRDAPSARKLLPGAATNPNDPNSGWVPWRKSDLDPEDRVTFVPMPVPSLVFPQPDDEGRQKIKLDVNDLVCWLTVGEAQEVNRFFYNAYMDGYNSWKELENFKKKGPAVAPWGQIGPDGRPSWMYRPQAVFAMDIDGHDLVPGRKSIDEVEAELAAAEGGNA